MICNERQYFITKAQRGKFELAIAELSSKKLPADGNQKIRHQVHLDALNSQLAEMLEEVEQYEKLKEGKHRATAI